MMSTRRPHNGRLFLWLAAATVPATMALLWLGWFVVREDRRVSGDGQRTALAQAADVGVAALGRTLAEFESALAAQTSAHQEDIPPLLARTPILVFDTDGVRDRAGLLLPYCPAVTRPSVALPDAFALADVAEFARAAPKDAVLLLEPYRRDDSPVVRGEALVRLARNHWKSGRSNHALMVLAELMNLGDTTVQERPAGLLARQGRALIFKQAGRRQDLQEEARALLTDLHAGRWRLTQLQFELAGEQAAEWLESIEPTTNAVPLDAAATDLLRAVDLVWHEIARGSRLDDRPRRAVHVNDHDVLVLTRSSVAGVAAMFITVDVVQAALLANLPSSVGDFAFTLIDDERRQDRRDAPGGHHVVERGTSVSGLPWTLAVTDRRLDSSRPLAIGTHMTLAAIGLMIAVLIASAYAIIRAVSGEMRIARLQADFVAAVSHEFRTPLTTIRQLSELLSSARVSTPARQQQFYDAILSESTRLQRLVEDLLDFGRMEAGRSGYSFEPIDLGALVDDVAASVERTAAASGHRVEVDRSSPVPPIRADRTALGHALRNLIENGVKYSPAHTVVRVSVRHDADRVHIGIQDWGLGIPAHEQEEIFEKFVRGTTSRDIAGTGVGLALAREIVRAHRGSISVESVAGQGSTFTVELPVEREAHA